MNIMPTQTLVGQSADCAASSEILPLEDMQKRHIEHILKMTQGRIRGEGGAAKLLGLKPSTLYSRMKKLNINATSHEAGRFKANSVTKSN